MLSTLARLSDRPLVRIGLFLVGLVGLWLPASLLWLLVTGWRPGVSFETLAPPQLLGTVIALYLAMLAVLWFFAHRLDGLTLAQYGLVRDRENALLVGIGAAIGVSGLALLVGLEVGLGWLGWDGRGLASAGIALAEGLAVGLGVGFIEELLFRGFLLETFARRYTWQTGALASALLFAAAHFIKAPEIILATWPQFPGLLLMGLVLAFARRIGGGRIGLCVGLHGGWVWAYYLVDTRDLTVGNQPGVPEWLTGIGGNPLAGVAGMVFLVLTGLLLSRLGGNWVQKSAQ